MSILLAIFLTLFYTFGAIVAFSATFFFYSHDLLRLDSSATLKEILEISIVIGLSTVFWWIAIPLFVVRIKQIDERDNDV